MLHHHMDLESLARRLIRSVTIDAARAVGSDAGRIAPGAPADLIAVHLPETPEISDQIALQTLLHTEKAACVYIAGEKVYG